MGVLYTVGITDYSVCDYYGGVEKIGGKGRKEESKEKKG
jgi:hypothetical protein